jgi:hypothetical protein
MTSGTRRLRPSTDSMYMHTGNEVSRLGTDWKEGSTGGEFYAIESIGTS